MTETEKRLAELRSVRDGLISTLRERIAEVEKERDEMLAEYARQIDELQADLSTLVPKIGGSVNTELADCIYDLLASYPGEPLTGHWINRRTGNVAVLPVVLARYIEEGKIVVRGRSYMVSAPDARGADDANTEHQMKAGVQ